MTSIIDRIDQLTSRIARLERATFGKRSPSPNRKSPARKRSRSPVQKRSRSPPQKRSRSPQQKRRSAERSVSPARRRPNNSPFKIKVMIMGDQRPDTRNQEEADVAFAQLKEVFMKYGTVVKCNMWYHRPNVYGSVSFASMDDVGRCMRNKEIIESTHGYKFVLE